MIKFQLDQANRWRKRGLHVMPIRYSLSWNKFIHHTTVVIHHGDGSVSIGHGGIDMGQGINTKVTLSTHRMFQVNIQNQHPRDSSDYYGDVKVVLIQLR